MFPLILLSAMKTVHGITGIKSLKNITHRRRQPIQIRRRWGKMSSEILLFDGMWRKVNDAFAAVGQYSQDLVSKSLEMYRLEQNQPFKFLKMWMFIRNYPQWNAMYCQVKKA